MPMGRREFILGLPGLFLPRVLETLSQTRGIKIDEFPVTGKESEYFVNLRLNPWCTLTNLFDLPPNLVQHFANEIVSCAVNFNPMFDRNSYGNLNLHRTGGNLWGRGEIIQNAIVQGRQVFLTVELPKNDSIPVSEWSSYIRSLAAQYPASHFIIGNEINAGFNIFWQENPDLFIKYYLVAAQAIKDKSPASRRLMYGEAYNQDGETLRKILGLMSQRGDLETIDGLSYHFYDHASKLPARTEMYQKIAKDFSLPPELFLTELGKPEISRLSPKEHSCCVVQNLSVALALVEKGAIETAIWHTAHQVGDPNRHSLTKHDAAGIPCQINPAFEAFRQVSKLLHHGIVLKDEGGFIVVTGKTSLNDDVTILWKKGKNVLNGAIEGNPRAQIYT